MNYWRMAMRLGNQGDPLFPDCRRRGIAAIGFARIVKDCRQFRDRKEYRRAFRRKWPRSGSAEKSLEYVCFDMKPGDIIYVKDGPRIAGKGVVTKSYAYDPNILKGAEYEWKHFVRVAWEDDFPEFECRLGAEPCTVLHLNPERVRKLRACEASARRTESAARRRAPQPRRLERG